MLPGIVAGCGSSDKKNAESSDGQTVITIANGSSEEDAKTYEIMQEQKEEFEAENPDLCDGSYRKPGI